MGNADFLHPAKKERLFTKDFSLAMVGGTGTAFMNHLFAAALALHVSALGGLAVHVGFIALAFSVSALITRPISGILSDKYGRTPQLIIGAVICAIGCILYGIAAFIPMLVAIRAFMGIGFGMHSTNAGAVAADVSPKSRLAEGIGIFGLGATFAQAVGPGLAIFIIGDGELTNFRNLFFFAAGMCVVSAVAGSLISYERKRKKEERLSMAKMPGPAVHPDIESKLGMPVVLESSTKAEGGGEVDANKEATGTPMPEPLPKTFLGFEYSVFPIIASLLLIFSGLAGLFFYLPALAVEAGFGNPAFYFVLSAVGIFLSRMAMGRVVDKKGADFVLIPGVIAMIIGYALIPLSNSLTMLVLMGLPIGFAHGAINPTFNALVFKRCSVARRGSASGAFFAAIDIGFGLGPIILGALADAFDLRFVFWGGSGLMAMGFILYLFIASEKPFIKAFAKYSGNYR